MEGFTLLLVYCFLFSILRISTTLDTVTPNQSVKDGETLVSVGGDFELGFFSPVNSKSRYLGIWYKKISTTTQTVVWVANRETPLSDPSGVLSITRHGILVLLNSTTNIVWSSSNTSRTARNPVAKLLESGNLVVKDGNDNNPDNFLWQSFDYPCDTLLPSMKIESGWNSATGLDRYLTSWKSTEDPAPGDYSFRIYHRGFPQLVLMKGNKIQLRVGSWNGLRFTGTSPLVKGNPLFKLEFVLNETEVYYTYKLINSSVVTRLVVDPSGAVQRFSLIDRTQGWTLFYTLKVDPCDEYAFCGSHASCDINNSPVCACLKGFVPKSPRDWSLLVWSDGCVRRTPLDCNNGSDGFLKNLALKLPDTSKSWFDKSMSLKQCEEWCLKNCSCSAYANSDIRGAGSGCLLWFGDLIDTRKFTENSQDLYVRMAASELIVDIETNGHSSSKKKQVGIIVSCVILVMGLLILGFILNTRKKKLRKQGAKEEIELPIFDLITIANATDNFSSNNKLGEGGFGPVYKGTLIEGQEIAVKRLSKSSGQGLKEFKNEVTMIAKLQHRNLVKLLGCCIQGDEKMLIYEYMTNKSLDYFIFDQTRSKLLDWHKCIHIIDGIARGLLYLHQDSRLRIIHRDLKASNVLLDKDMNPKISDFGMARTFGGDETEANTKIIVGTYGYMSPEYVVDGLFSMKSDVFSFGVLVLEILSGKKNRGFCHPDHHLNLLGHLNTSKRHVVW